MRIVIWAQASHRPERFLTPLPEQRPLRLVFGNAYPLTAMLLTDSRDTGGVLFHAVSNAVELNQHQRSSVQGQPRLNGPFHRLDGQVIHHFQGSGDDTSAD